jgi:hypothetical protein
MLVSVATLFQGCKDEAYDFNAIEPVVMVVNGPTVGVAAHGLLDFPFTYRVPPRGGSSWAWSFDSAKWGGTIIQDPDKPYIAYIVFDQSDVDTEAVIRVVETTMGGVSSPVKELLVNLIAFCPYDMDYWVGEIQGTAGHNDPVMIGSRTPNLNQLRVHGLAGFVNFSWGENWVDGDGSCILDFSCGDNVVIQRQWLGDSDYPDVYFIEGEGPGTIDEAAGTITISYKVYYTGSSTGVITTTLTKIDGKFVVTDSFEVPAKK